MLTMKNSAALHLGVGAEQRVDRALEGVAICRLTLNRVTA